MCPLPEGCGARAWMRLLWSGSKANSKGIQVIPPSQDSSTPMLYVSAPFPSPVASHRWASLNGSTHTSVAPSGANASAPRTDHVWPSSSEIQSPPAGAHACQALFEMRIRLMRPAPPWMGTSSGPTSCQGSALLATAMALRREALASHHASGRGLAPSF